MPVRTQNPSRAGASNQQMLCRIMVAFDGSDPSMRALKLAAELAAKFDIPLWSISVVQDLPSYMTTTPYGFVDSGMSSELASQRDAFAAQLTELAKECAARSGCEITAEAAVGSPVESIIEAVRAHECDLLVIGLRTHPGLVDRLLPHCGREITEHAPCAVLAVR